MRTSSRVLTRRPGSASSAADRWRTDVVRVGETLELPGARPPPGAALFTRVRRDPHRQGSAVSEGRTSTRILRRGHYKTVADGLAQVEGGVRVLDDEPDVARSDTGCAPVVPATAGSPQRRLPRVGPPPRPRRQLVTHPPARLPPRPRAGARAPAARPGGGRGCGSAQLRVQPRLDLGWLGLVMSANSSCFFRNFAT